MRVVFLSMLLIGALTASIGCGATMADDTETKEETSPAQQPELREPTAEEVEAAKTAGKVQVVLDTAKGKITLEVDGAAAPIAVANFLNLVRAGFYNGMPFHRVEPGFVIQAGDPRLVERPPVGYTIEDEKSPIKHLRGTIAMARVYRGGQMVPNSGSTQFYICLGDAPHLDRMGFTAFGKITEEMKVIDEIRVGDKVVAAKVLEDS